LAIFDYLAEANCGVIEFMMAIKLSRQSGLGSALRAYTEKLLSDDARRNGNPGLACVLAEMNDPFALNSLDDNLDPFVRARIWSAWGYKRLDFPYVQPALSADQDPVRNLLLIAKPMDPAYAQEIPATQLLAAVAGYMIWAMRIETPQNNAEFGAMQAYLKSATHVALKPLDEYTGRSARKPLDVRDIVGRDDPDLTPTLAIYRQEFPGGDTDVTPGEIEAFLENRADGERDWAYHLWALRAAPDDAVEGIASFFTFPHAGFGGYVAFSNALRGSGRFALTLARMEEATRRFGADIAGFYIECDPGKQAFFSQFGFHTVDFTYRQPPLSSSTAYAVNDAPPLSLMYKELGRRYDLPMLTTRDFLIQLGEIFTVVYGVVAPEESAFFRDISRQADAWRSDTVRFSAVGAG
jgi:hypothetical protein